MILDCEFPSPLGEMGLSISRSWQLLSVITLLVSVPSRGNGVIDQLLARAIVLRSFTWFPSPLGEMGLSIQWDIVEFSVSVVFPSPLGEMGLSIEVAWYDSPEWDAFPSPLGEMGLSIGGV